MGADVLSPAETSGAQQADLCSDPTSWKWPKSQNRSQRNHCAESAGFILAKISVLVILLLVNLNPWKSFLRTLTSMINPRHARPAYTFFCMKLVAIIQLCNGSGQRIELMWKVESTTEGTWECMIVNGERTMMLNSMEAKQKRPWHAYPCVWETKEVLRSERFTLPFCWWSNQGFQTRRICCCIRCSGWKWET